jgi:rhodanese-related sulfurtransferase
MHPVSLLGGGLLAISLAGSASASDATQVPENKRTKAELYLTAAEAADFLHDKSVVFLDVRSRPEVTFIGMPTRVNVHIPLMVMPSTPRYDASRESYGLEMNSAFEFDFLDYAEAVALAEDTPIVIICRSGSRSAKAANIVYDLGFTQVYSIVDGFEGDKAKDGPHRGQRAVNGWKNAGLDWAYSIAPEQAYPLDRSATGQ